MTQRSSNNPGEDRPKKRRIEFRRNRLRPARRKNWDLSVEEDNKADLATTGRESVKAKGDLSRKRTVMESGDETGIEGGELVQGTAIAVRGQYVDVDDGRRIWPCTIRRILRTLLIRERSPVIVGDQVAFTIVADQDGIYKEGVIERVLPRRTWLTRSDGRKTHIIAVNVDQTMIVSSFREPALKPHLIDRYLVASHAGNLPAIICLNKADLAEEDEAGPMVERYSRLGYNVVVTSAETGQGIDFLRDLLTNKVTLIAGQSGVGKSSLLNVVQPDLNLDTATVSAATEKGRHTTTTAVWLKLNTGGVVVDTPGIRALDVAMVPLEELETHFIEFIDLLKHCKYPNCVHIHEDGCVIQQAVEEGRIDESRYDSYVELFYELSETRRKHNP